MKRSPKRRTKKKRGGRPLIGLMNLLSTLMI